MAAEKDEAHIKGNCSGTNTAQNAFAIGINTKISNAGGGEWLTKIPSRFPAPHRCFFSSSSGIPSFMAASLIERSPD